MEHITNNSSDEVTSDLKSSKGTTAKKKCKKTKDSNENLSIINNTASDNVISNDEIIDETLDHHIHVNPNNHMPNGVNNDHNDHTLNKSSNEIKILNSDKCERFSSESTEVIVEKLESIDLKDHPESDLANTEGLDSKDSQTYSSIKICPDCGDDNCTSPDSVSFESYKSELQMAEIMRLIQKDLSEPYSIYTYRYFIHNWPKLCFLAMHNKKCIGAIVCKLDLHRKVKRGYIAMLAVDEKFRKKKIGSHLVRQAITAMVSDDAEEVVLETEITNKPALRLYGNLGFVRDKRLFRYYLNGVDALRLKLWLR